MLKVKYLLSSLFSLLLIGLAAGGAEVRLEDLGAPVSFSSLSPFGVTRSGDRETAWAIVRSPEQRGLAGFNVETGESVFVDLDRFQSSLFMARVFENKIYCLMTDVDRRKGLFISYDPATGKLTEHPVDSGAQVSYFMQGSGDITSGGVFYAGLYPQTQLCWLDTETGKTGFTQRLSREPAQKYLIYVVADRHDGTVYASAGLHHYEILRYNPATGQAKQIFEDLQMKGRANLTLGGDGRAYFTAAGRYYRCEPDRAVEVAAIPDTPSSPGFHLFSDLRLSGNREVDGIDFQCRLKIRDLNTGKLKIVPTDFPTVHPLVYSICGGLSNRIWVGSFSPAALSSFDAAADQPEYTDYGQMSSGRVQIYWMLETPKKSYTSSYTGGNIDLLDLEKKSFKNVVNLSKKDEQERIFMLIPATDGNIYGPTMPIKAVLGGGIVELNPATDKYVFYRNVIADQSIRALAVAPGDLLFGVSDVNGGTSAIAKAKIAEIFLWDTKEKKTVWQSTPLATEKTYLGAYSVDENRFWTVGSTTRTVVLFNAATRKVERTISLPGGKKGLRPIGSAAVLGPRAFLLHGDSLLDVNLETGKVTTVLTSPVIEAKFKGGLHGTHAEYMAPDGTAFFGSESKLYRVKLK